MRRRWRSVFPAHANTGDPNGPVEACPLMRSHARCSHDGPEHNALQAEAGYIDARPYLPDRRNFLQRAAGPYIRVRLGLTLPLLELPGLARKADVCCGMDYASSRAITGCASAPGAHVSRIDTIRLRPGHGESPALINIRINGPTNYCRY